MAKSLRTIYCASHFHILQKDAMHCIRFLVYRIISELIMGVLISRLMLQPL
jgi:hypothetical protein